MGWRGDPPSQLNSSICILIPTCRSRGWRSGEGLHLHITCTPPPTRFELCPADRVSRTRALYMYNNRQFNKPRTIKPLIPVLYGLHYTSYLPSFHAQVTYVTNQQLLYALFYFTSDVFARMNLLSYAFKLQKLLYQ